MKFSDLSPETQALNPELKDKDIQLPKKPKAKVDKKTLFWDVWKEYRPLSYPMPIEEFRFALPERRYRFDYCFYSNRLGIEVNGGNWMVKNGVAVGRHTKDSDLNKLNLAASMGWRLIHFSPTMLNSDPIGCVKIVVRALDYKRDPNA